MIVRRVSGPVTPALLQTEEGILPLAVPPETTVPLLTLPLSRRLTAFGFLLIAEFFYGWAWNTVDVLRPLFRASLGLSLTQAGSAYSAQGAGALLGALSIGQLADRLGRRTMLVVVMAGYGLMLLAGTLVTSYATLLLQRFALGLFLGGSFPVVVGIYVELSDPRCVANWPAPSTQPLVSRSSHWAWRLAISAIETGGRCCGWEACRPCSWRGSPFWWCRVMRGHREDRANCRLQNCLHPRCASGLCCWQR